MTNQNNNTIDSLIQVQSYLNELWKGGLPWTANTIKVVNNDDIEMINYVYNQNKYNDQDNDDNDDKENDKDNDAKVVLVFFAMLICPPIWIFFSLPLDIRL